MSDHNTSITNNASATTTNGAITDASLPYAAGDPDQSAIASATTGHTGKPLPTLGELIADRVAQLDEWKREQRQADQRATEEVHAGAIAYMTDWLEAHVSAELLAALRAIPACDETKINLGDPVFTASAKSAIALLDLAGTDIDPEATHADHEEGRWLIVRERDGIYGAHWYLRGPHRFRARLCDQDDRDRKIDAPLLDALRAYPAWVAAEPERIAAEEAKQRKRARLNTPPTFTRISGPEGILMTGRRVQIRVLNPIAADDVIEYSGTLVDWEDGWLLLESYGGIQRVIPTARIQDVQALPPAEDEE